MRGIVALFVLLLALPVAASGEIIHACVKKGSGILRIVADAEACRRMETSLSWNVRGPEGPPGETGMEGEPGPQGLPGPVLHVFDANGDDLGLNVAPDAFSAGPLFAVVRLTNGFIVAISLYTGRLYSSSPLVAGFTETNCKGQAFGLNVGAIAGLVVGPAASPLFVVRDEGIPSAPQILLSQSVQYEDGPYACRNEVFSPLAPAPALDPIAGSDLGIAFPVALPLRIAPAPE